MPPHGTLVFSEPHRSVGFISFPFLLRLCEDAVPSDESLEGDNRLTRCLAACNRNLSQLCNALIALSCNFSKLPRVNQSDLSDSISSSSRRRGRSDLSLILLSGPLRVRWFGDAFKDSSEAPAGKPILLVDNYLL